MNNIDWNKLWKENKKVKAENDTVQYWDSRAGNFRKKEMETDPYAEQFYEYMNAEKEDTLFDMGCGSGILAIPFAKKGHQVWAADFSQEMLNRMMDEADLEGVADRIHPIKLDWEEDWSERGLPVCDIAFASRSMHFNNLTESLNKLETMATKYCCLGAWDGPGEGLTSCYITMGDLMSRDKKPELRYIEYLFRSESRGVEYIASTGFIKWNIVK